jgi:flagellar P-ring protein precursor FlgI
MKEAKKDNLKKVFMKRFALIYIMTLLVCVSALEAERIKDIVDIGGIRSNPLTGVGLVVGLSGTGDSTLPSQQMLTNILRRAGLNLSPADLSGGNVAIVMVTAELGPFSREGSRLDVDVSSIGDAKTLQGGMLLPTPLEGFDGEVYAVTQAAGLSLGGWSASGNKASVSKNHPTVGRIPDGAIVERAELSDYVEYIGSKRIITLNLRNNDFTTARRIKDAISEHYPGSSTVIDSGTIQIVVPERIITSMVAGFIDEITSCQVRVDVPAVVVINERTGTIVVGENVGISAVAISQGSLVVKVKEMPIVSQPMAPFSDAGETKVIEDTTISVKEETGYLIPVPETITISELAKNLNAIGATPTDLIAIFNALKKAGALQARLEIM